MEVSIAEFNGRIGHLEDIESPWSNAGGVIKTIDELEKIAKTGVGTIEDGSHVLGGERLSNAVDPDHPELGPVKKVYDYDPKTGRTYNSFNLPGMGFDALEPEIPERVRIAEAYGKKYILNVVPVTSSPVEELVELVDRGYAQGAHAVLVNAGCPNVVLEDGGRKELLSRNPRMLLECLLALEPVVEKYGKPILLRISPQLEFKTMNMIMAVIRLTKSVGAVYTPNAWPGVVPLDGDGNPILEVPGGIGGFSGPASAQAAQQETGWIIERLKGSGIDVVRSAGIMNAAELNRALGSGAVAGCGTTFFYEPVNGWAEDVDKVLNDLSLL